MLIKLEKESCAAFGVEQMFAERADWMRGDNIN